MRSAWLAVAMALAAPGALAAEELRTLFHSADERARLDRQRRGEPLEAPAAIAPRKPVVSGFVKRSDGRATVWIDGRPVTMTSAAAAELVEASKPGRDSRPRVEIKPAR